MTTAHKYEGEILTVLAPYDVDSGEAAKVGQIVGVALHDALNTASVNLAVEGVFDIAKEADAEFTAGAKVYWDNTDKCVTPDAAIVGQGNTLIGVATMAAAAADATARVRLNAKFVASEAALPE